MTEEQTKLYHQQCDHPLLISIPHAVRLEALNLLRETGGPTEEDIAGLSAQAIAADLQIG